MASKLDPCGICREPYSSEMPAASIHGPEHPDNHYFHRICFENWFNTRQAQNDPRRPFCPLCTRNIKHIDSHEIPLIPITDIISAVCSQDIEAVRNFLRGDNLPAIDVAFLLSLNRVREEGGNPNIMQLLSEHTSALHRGVATLMFAKDGDINCLRIILASGSISLLYRLMAISTARVNGRHDIVSLLCEGCNGGLIRAAGIATLVIGTAAICYQNFR